MRKIDDKPIPDVRDELRLFTMARNEALRMPYFFDYYEKRGVDRFFFIENNSDDTTLQMALERPNVHVFQTRENFKNYFRWMELLLQNYGHGHWCLAVDLDEFLVYPHCERLPLRSLIGYLEAQGFDALRCVLLDMYGKAELGKEEHPYRPGDDPLAHTPYFDPDFDTEERMRLNERAQRRFRSTRFGGGMRKRVFDVNANLTKIPLFLYDKKRVFTAAGMHAIDGVRMADVRGALLHFKYLHDFVGRTVEESQRGQHAGGGAFYKPMAQALTASTPVSLWYPESVRYEHSGQLVDCGVMASAREFESYCSNYVLKSAMSSQR